MTKKHNRKLKAEINIVPYVDVMMVLLVIFMASAQLNDSSMINLPNARRSVTQPNQYIEIILKPNHLARISIRGRKESIGKKNEFPRKDLKKILQTLHENNPNMPVMISADKDIKYQEVIGVISTARVAGVNRVGLATER
jgi:biopolymer transport protein TolR